MNINQTLENLRVTYQLAKLDIEDCLPEPVDQFNAWFEAAMKSHCDEPNAFVLSTVRNNQPRARVLLLKGVQPAGFVFYTNYRSAKGDELAQDQRVSMTFLWLPLQRQIRIEGRVTKVSDAQSDEYFHKRPRGSQLGAIASPQSRRLNSRQELEDLFKKVEEDFRDVELLPRPANWGGYIVVPEFFEFWQGRKNRMHDRICYEKKGNSWELYRLAP